MKFHIDNYEIDIKAKGLCNETRNNKKDVMYFMNFISLLALNAEENYRHKGADALAEQAGKWSDEIHEQLKAMDCYI